MTLAAHVQNFAGAAFRHIPASSPFDVSTSDTRDEGPTIVGMNRATPRFISLATKAA